jgi:hypothetical protein
VLNDPFILEIYQHENSAWLKILLYIVIRTFNLRLIAGSKYFSSMSSISANVFA